MNQYVKIILEVINRKVWTKKKKNNNFFLIEYDELKISVYNQLLDMLISNNNYI